MKRVIVRYVDDKGNVSVFATDSMPDDEAEAERKRIQREHAEAGEANRWIEVGPHSVQSRQIQTISVQDPPSGPRVGFADDDDGPRFRRDMKF
jgi:hypothetical protein